MRASPSITCEMGCSDGRHDEGRPQLWARRGMVLPRCRASRFRAGSAHQLPPPPPPPPPPEEPPENPLPPLPPGVDTTVEARLPENEVKLDAKRLAWNGPGPTYQLETDFVTSSPANARSQRSTLPNITAYGRYAVKRPSCSANFARSVSAVSM